jgi:hypothetical protein
MGIQYYKTGTRTALDEAVNGDLFLEVPGGIEIWLVNFDDKPDEPQHGLVAWHRNSQLLLCMLRCEVTDIQSAFAALILELDSEKAKGRMDEEGVAQFLTKEELAKEASMLRARRGRLQPWSPQTLSESGDTVLEWGSSIRVKVEFDPGYLGTAVEMTRRLHAFTSAEGLIEWAFEVFEEYEKVFHFIEEMNLAAELASGEIRLMDLFRTHLADLFGTFDDPDYYRVRSYKVTEAIHYGFLQLNIARRVIGKGVGMPSLLTSQQGDLFDIPLHVEEPNPEGTLLEWLDDIEGQLHNMRSVQAIRQRRLLRGEGEEFTPAELALLEGSFGAICKLCTATEADLLEREWDFASLMDLNMGGLISPITLRRTLSTRMGVLI